MNYTPVTDFIKNDEGKITGVIARDTINKQSYNIKAKQVINATGVFSDRIRLKANPLLAEKVVLSKGEHLSISLLKNEDDSALPSKIIINLSQH